MTKPIVVCAAVAALALGTAQWAMSQAPAAQTGAAAMTFFITSAGPGDGANLGGLAGADAFCLKLATAVGAGEGRTWRAYLSASASGNQAAVNARDRIGPGPWQNVKGVVVARNVEDLHSADNKLSKENSLTEKGGTVNGIGDTPNTHDMLTGSDQQGKLPDGATNCNNWTSNSNGTGAANVGHHDRQGGGAAATSWNASHASRGCSQPNLVASGGAGLFYCFAQRTTAR